MPQSDGSQTPARTAMPKSVSMATQSPVGLLNIRFAGVTSRWTNPRRCTASKASEISLPIRQTHAGWHNGGTGRRVRLARVPGRTLYLPEGRPLEQVRDQVRCTVVRYADIQDPQDIWVLEDVHLKLGFALELLLEAPNLLLRPANAVASEGKGKILSARLVVGEER